MERRGDDVGGRGGGRRDGGGDEAMLPVSPSSRQPMRQIPVPYSCSSLSLELALLAYSSYPINNLVGTLSLAMELCVLGSNTNGFAASCLYYCCLLGHLVMLK